MCVRDSALRMSDEINAQFGFERAFGKTNAIENSADTDTKITKFGISFNSDGTTTVSYTHLDDSCWTQIKIFTDQVYQFLIGFLSCSKCINPVSYTHLLMP